MFKKAVFFAEVLICLSLCACAGVNMSDYTRQSLDEQTCNNVLPSYVVNKRKPKVAVLPPSDATVFAKSNMNLSSTCQENLTQLLAETGSVEVVERGQLKQLMQEMKFESGVTGEIDAQKFMEIAKNVDYVLVGSISAASINASFTEASSWTDKKGVTHYSPPSCKETGNVSIDYRLVSFPSGKIVATLPMSGTKFSVRDVRSSYECAPRNTQLIYDAINRAVDDSKETLIADLPVYGYVYKTMTSASDPKKRLAYISLGTADGLSAGNKVDIMEFTSEKDPVSGTLINSETSVAECKVLENELTPDRSICVPDEEGSGNVHVKDAVKTQVNESVFRKINKLVRSTGL